MNRNIVFVYPAKILAIGGNVIGESNLLKNRAITASFDTSDTVSLKNGSDVKSWILIDFGKEL